jgi:hypothetical protein
MAGSECSCEDTGSGVNMTVRVRQGALAIAAVVVACCATSALGGRPADAAGAPSCAGVNVVFARGSGQPLGYREAPRFFQKLTARLGSTVSVATYELGTEAHAGARYPAAGVGVDSAQEIVNVLDAWTGAPGGTYRASVQAGADELAAYLAERAAACPAEREVVGGYSQGAQAVGDGLARASAAALARVAFVALFGDPRLYLPEGKGLVPPACRGGTRSPWRRGNVGCLTDNGILGARNPYLPASLVSRTGSWCDRNDPICNGNIADLPHSTHSHYSDAGAGMDESVVEIGTLIATIA